MKIYTIAILAVLFTLPFVGRAQEQAASTNYTAICQPCASNVSHVAISGTNSYQTANYNTVNATRLQLSTRNSSASRVYYTHSAVTGTMSTSNNLYLEAGEFINLAPASATYNGPISLCTTASAAVVLPVEESYKQQ